MKKSRRLKTMVTAGIVGVAIVGCGGSGGGSSGTGGTTALPTSSGGKGPSTGGVGSGGVVGTGGVQALGGVQSSGGAAGTSEPGSGGRLGGGGAKSAGGVTGLDGGAETGGRATGGAMALAGSSGSGGGAGGGGSTTAGTGGIGGASGGAGTSGTCTASKDTGKTASGSGPHKVVIETNSAPGIKCGTIYRPADLGGTDKYPILVWGEGACTQNGLDNQTAMGEIASHGYFIVADGTPGGSGACTGGQDGKAFLDYISWAIAENGKSCSAYYQSLDATKIAADGFSCGGLMAENVSGDPRFTAIGITSSGLFSANQELYKKIHTPFKILLGGTADMAYPNGERDYDQISALGIPIILFSKDGAGHGGDLGNAKGDFNTVNLAWLNWQLKGDTGATGKGLLYGGSCKYCTATGWEFKSKNIP